MSNKPKTHILSVLRWILLLGVAGGCLGMLLAFRTGNGELARILRFAASSSAVALGAACGAFASWYGRWMFIALVCCWFGDWFLMDFGFLPGLTAFLLGHLAFITAFCVRGVGLRYVAVSAAAMVIPACVVMMWLRGRIPMEYQLAVVAYVIAISLMVAFAFGTTLRHGAPLIAVAAVVFYASDLFVARSAFVQQDLFNSVFGLPLYYAAFVLFGLAASQATAQGLKQGWPNVVESTN